MYEISKKPFLSVFDIAPAQVDEKLKSISALTFLPHEYQDYVPPIDPNYVFDLELAKTILLSLDGSAVFGRLLPLLLWGLHGTGKTSAIEQTCARLNRPCMRVQHTICTEEADIVGQWTVQNGATEFQLGPLPIAMQNGWVYLADDCDFGSPTVLSLYQPVLEGKPLVIKNAPPHLRIIKPHPQFRFAATGNTNGTGDETGLYQGTQLQNMANYSRFAVTYQVDYLPKEIETSIVRKIVGFNQEHANQLVDFANDIRKNYHNNQISMPISTRELIFVAAIMMMSHGNWYKAFDLGYINRLSPSDQVVARGYVQRKFGIEF